MKICISHYSALFDAFWINYSAYPFVHTSRLRTPFLKWKIPGISGDGASTTLWTFLHQQGRNPFQEKARWCLQHDSGRFLPYLDGQDFGHTLIAMWGSGTSQQCHWRRGQGYFCKVHKLILIPISEETEMSILRIAEEQIVPAYLTKCPVLSNRFVCVSCVEGRKEQWNGERRKTHINFNGTLIFCE